MFFFSFHFARIEKNGGRSLIYVENMFNSFIYLTFYHFFYLTKQVKIALIHLPFSFHSPTFNSCPIKRTQNLYVHIESHYFNHYDI